MLEPAGSEPAIYCLPGSDSPPPPKKKKSKILEYVQYQLKLE